MEDTCKVPCQPVQTAMKEKLDMKIFMWIIGGIAAFTLVLNGISTKSNSDTAAAVQMMTGKLDSALETSKENKVKLQYVDKSIEEIGRKLDRMNRTNGSGR